MIKVTISSNVGNGRTNTVEIAEGKTAGEIIKFALGEDALNNSKSIFLDGIEKISENHIIEENCELQLTARNIAGA